MTDSHRQALGHDVEGEDEDTDLGPQLRREIVPAAELGRSQETHEHARACEPESKKKRRQAHRVDAGAEGSHQTMVMAGESVDMSKLVPARAKSCLSGPRAAWTIRAVDGSRSSSAAVRGWG